MLSLAIPSSFDLTANDFLFVSWKSFGFLRTLSFIAQKILTRSFDNFLSSESYDTGTLGRQNAKTGGLALKC